MSLPAPSVLGQFRRSPLVFFGFLLLVLAAVYKASEYILTNDNTGLLFVLGAFLAGAVLLATLNNWRHGLYIFLIWLLFEDLVRKFLGNNMMIYFAKDVLVVVVYLSFFLDYRRKAVRTFRAPFLLPLLVFIWFGVMQVFNPASTGLAYGLLGLKLYFYYIPLFLVGYALLDSEDDLRRFFFVNLFLAAVIGGLGIAQSMFGHTFLNPEHPAEDIRGLSQLYRISPLTGTLIYRPTSVFVSDGRFSYYMILTWLLAFGLSGYLLLRSRRGRLLTSLALALISVAVVLSGSRGALLWTFGSALVCAAAFLWSAPWRQGHALRIVRALQRALLVGGLAFVTLLAVYPEALMSRVAFYSETLSMDSPSSELVWRTRDYPLRNFLAAFDDPRWPYGHGIGTASLGIQYITRILGVPSIGIGVENGFGTLVVEMGIVGLLLWLVLSTAVVFQAWRVVQKLRGSPWFPMGFVIFWFAALLLFPFTYTSMVHYQNFVLNAFFWLLLGILFRLPHIALHAQTSATGGKAFRVR